MKPRTRDGHTAIHTPTSTLGRRASNPLLHADLPEGWTASMDASTKEIVYIETSSNRKIRTHPSQPEYLLQKVQTQKVPPIPKSDSWLEWFFHLLVGKPDWVLECEEQQRKDLLNPPTVKKPSRRENPSIIVNAASGDDGTTSFDAGGTSSGEYGQHDSHGGSGGSWFGDLFGGSHSHYPGDNTHSSFSASTSHSHSSHSYSSHSYDSGGYSGGHDCGGGGDSGGHH
ncbi:hypothetical protein T439DRAFT_354634 [Meredithblackwellia eburnea MCA 4105]